MIDKQIQLKPGTALVGVCSDYGNPIRFHDDTGPLCALWVYRDAEGLRCVVSADTWHDALEAAYDTLPTIPPEDVPEAYGFDSQEELDAAIAAECPELQEGYVYQSNASGTGIVAFSLSGESLDPLTVPLLKALGWRLTVATY